MAGATASAGAATDALPLVALQPVSRPPLRASAAIKETAYVRCLAV